MCDAPRLGKDGMLERVPHLIWVAWCVDGVRNRFLRSSVMAAIRVDRDAWRSVRPCQRASGVPRHGWIARLLNLAFLHSMLRHHPAVVIGR